MKTSLSIFACFLLFLVINAHSDICSAVEESGNVAQQLQPTSKPSIIYVSDFALDVSRIEGESGIVGRRGLLGGELLKRRGPLRHEDDPAATAANLVDLLARSITDKLNEESVPAMRLPPGESPPASGWIVGGQFLEVNEGNRLERAVIGFGTGASDMQIQVEVFDLGFHPDTPFLTFGSETGSGKKPGAIITLNPYVAAAKFVLSKNAPEKDVKHAGEKIAQELIKYMKARGLISAS